MIKTRHHATKTRLSGNKMWHKILNVSSTSSGPESKDVEIDNKTESSKPMLKKAISMDSLHNKPINAKKRNGSFDTYVFGYNWFSNGKKSPTSECSTSSQDENYVIALIGKPSVGKSTILRTGLNNLTPSKNIGVENVSMLLTEIDVDDQSYPVEVLEIQENAFDMKSPVQWPKMLPEIDGILVCYDVTSRASIANIAWLLNAFKEFQIPMILVACKGDCELSKRQVDETYGPKLGDLFNIGFVEFDTRTDTGIQKIHDVFSMLLRLSIRHREFSRQNRTKNIYNKAADSSSDSLFLQSVSSDAESEKATLSHRRTASDLSHESRGRRRFSNFSAIRFMSSRYNNHFGPKSDSRKSRSPLNRNRLSSDDEGGSPTHSHSRSVPRSISYSEVSKHIPSIAITPPQTPPTPSILSQMSLPPPPGSPNKIYHPERNSHRRSILPSSTLLQVKESEEEKDILSVKSINSRISTASYDSTLSSMSGRSEDSLTWAGLFMGDPLDRGPNKCTGNRADGMTIDELIHRLTTGGQYGTHDDPFTIAFFVLYRAFMRPREVLVKLMQKFQECEKDIKDHRNTTHEKICNLLYNWIIQHPNDMIHPHTRLMLQKFFDKISKCSHLTYYTITLNSLVNGTVPLEDPDSIWGLSDVNQDEPDKEMEGEKMKETKKDSGIGSWILRDDAEDSTASPSQLSRPSLLNNRKASLIILNNGSVVRPICQVPFEELPDKAIAGELTYQEFTLFKKITARDLLRHIWSPQGSPQRDNGKVAQSIKHFNLISNWVASMILSQEKLKNRAAMLKKFMKVAIIVRESNNYNTLMAIIAAINSAPIARLRRTRELLKGKSTYKKFHNLEVLMSTDKSFGNYRMALKAPSRGHEEQLGIPYLGIHLQDLLSIGEGNRNFQEDGRVHWNKFSLMGDIIIMIRNFQKRSYNLKSSKFIEKFITDTSMISDDELYNKSLDLEPRIQRSSSASRVRR